jgi:signal transduction histidine kinase
MRNSARDRLKLIGTVVLFVSMVKLLSPSVATAQRAAAPKRIMVLHWYGRDWRTNSEVEQNMQAVFQSAPAGSVEYYSEYLEADRFPGSDQAAILRDYLRKKYAKRPIDVVAAIGDVPLRFLLRYRDELFPQTPIVFSVVKTPAAKEMTAGPGMTGIVYTFGYKQTLDLALKLHPGTKQVFIVSGTLNHDKTYEEMGREKLQGYDSKASIIYLTDLSPHELIDKMKSLPDRSIVLYVWQQVYDEQNKLLESRDVLSSIAASAPVPIYGMASWQVGGGIVGGYVRFNSAATTRVAEIALQIANGARAQHIPVETATIVPMFDWRELKRWGISQALLPLGSVVEFKEPTFWQQYKGRIVGILTLVAIQTLFIAALLVERRKRQLAKMALAQLNADLEQRVDDRTAALAAKTKELETFSYSVAHDLKAPLRGIEGYSRLLLEDQFNRLDEEGRAFLHTIRDSTERMNQLIDDLLAYSRIERRALRAEPIELRPFVQRLVEERRSELKVRGISLTMEVNGSVVFADAEGLSQALRNYLDNAIKFTAEAPEPRIEVGADETEKSCRLWVRDNGVGFDMKHHDRIFDIFQRLHPLKDYPGTGVGLAIVRKAIERMGGKVWAESEPGRGATFYLEVRK